MKIKKLGHCCMVVEVKGKRIMTDPSNFDYGGNSVDERELDAVLFTHEHADHLHLDTLKEILKHNKKVKIISNTSVSKLLNDAGIEYIKVEDGESFDLDGVNISGFGTRHAEIYEDFGQVQNTGYMIDTFCYPGELFQHTK